MVRPSPPVDFEWVESSGVLGLAWKGLPNAKPLVVDFLSPRFRRRLKTEAVKKSLLARSVGFTHSPMTLVDATLGLAQDAMIFAALGCDVVGLERSPVVFELVADGLRRAQTDERFWEQIKGSLRIENVDATTWLASSKREFQVCYVDPMFAVKKSALSSKAMQILQALLGEDAAPSTLVELAINGARSQPKARVVVKRPRKAAPLKVGVHHAVIGSVIRYDVYQ